eukprot:1174170-Karenia_brevis.AAC.1
MEFAPCGKSPDKTKAATMDSHRAPSTELCNHNATKQVDSTNHIPARTIPRGSSTSSGEVLAMRLGPK